MTAVRGKSAGQPGKAVSLPTWLSFQSFLKGRLAEVKHVDQTCQAVQLGC